MTQQTIPPEMLDLVKFMCKCWAENEQFIYEHCTEEQLIHYPILQGSRNRWNIKAIGQQEFDVKNIRIAIDWLLANGK